MEKLDIRNKADIDTNLPLISIIGRPNAGKSTLFNRLIGKRRAITDPTPGVTRDPIPERWLLGNNPVTLVDSGGVKLDKDGIDFAVTDKSLSLLDISTAIIFLMDCTDKKSGGFCQYGQSGISPSGRSRRLCLPLKYRYSCSSQGVPCPGRSRC